MQQHPTMPTGSSHLSYTLSALTAAGGVMGYYRSRSLRSLAAGLLFGAGKITICRQPIQLNAMRSLAMSVIINSSRWRLCAALQRAQCACSRLHFIAALDALDVAGFAFAGYKISTDEQLRGYRFGTTTSALLTGVMGYRYYTTRKAMPALPLSVLGLIGVAYHGAKYMEWADGE